MTTLLVAAIFPWLLIAVGTWLGYQLVCQNGRILLRLEAFEKRLAKRAEQAQERPAGLPLGTAAPDFELPDLAGLRRRLSDFRGRDLLLIFFNPNCGFCTKMASDLAALPAEGGNGQATPIVITTGDASENQRLIEQFGIRCVVLLQEQMDVAMRFLCQGTPMGYRIDSAGRIASELAVGGEALLKLADLKHVPGPAAKAGNSGAVHKGKGKHPDPSLAKSKLNRSGLKAGAVAPDFSLPLVGGGQLALADLRGRRVLLVFSDPNCGPCDELAPRLQELHEQRPELLVVVISRRDAEAVATKAAALGFTYPIVIQQQWEVSKQYGMFATPIGYLIDEEGIVVEDVAVGVEPILALARRPVPLYAEAEPSSTRKEVLAT